MAPRAGGAGEGGDRADGPGGKWVGGRGGPDCTPAPVGIGWTRGRTANQPVPKAAQAPTNDSHEGRDSKEGRHKQKKMKTHT